MNELTFARPELWPLLFLIVPLWFGVFVLIERRRERVRAYGAVLRERVPASWARASRIAAAAGLLLLTWMEPRWGEEKIQIERRGLDIVFCLDLSRSMLARDMEPNRLARAKRDIRSMLPSLKGGDRIGLVGFAGEARLIVPMTHDLDSFRQLLETVDTDSVRTGGTDLAAAIRKALEVLDPETSSSSKAVVLLTDGEDRVGSGQKAARSAAARDVVLHAVGYGSTKGSKIAIAGSGTDEHFLRDEKGDEVVSALDSDGLRNVAQAAGGEFLRADVMVLPLQELKSKRLDAMTRRGYEAGEETVHKNRFQWVLLPALLLLFWDMLMAGGRRR